MPTQTEVIHKLEQELRAAEDHAYEAQDLWLVKKEQALAALLNEIEASAVLKDARKASAHAATWQSSEDYVAVRKAEIEAHAVAQAAREASIEAHAIAQAAREVMLEAKAAKATKFAALKAAIEAGRAA